MNNKVLVLISMLISINAPAMQQQQQRHQHQNQQHVQQQKNRTRQQWHSNDKGEDVVVEKPKEKDQITTDLMADMAAILDHIAKVDGSVDAHIKNIQKKKRIILCGICYQPDCPFSKEVYE